MIDSLLASHTAVTAGELSSFLHPQYPQYQWIWTQNQNLDGNHGNDFLPQQWRVTTVTTALGKASVDSYRTTVFSSSGLQKIITLWLLTFFGFCKLEVFVTKWFSISFSLLYLRCRLSKQQLRIESGSIYFGYIFSPWPPAWIMPTMLTSWGRAIFTEGWASIIALQKHGQPQRKEGKVWPISHHSPILGLAYLKHLTIWPQQCHRSCCTTRPTAQVKHLHLYNIPPGSMHMCIPIF